MRTITLILLACLHALGQFDDRGRLVAGRFERRVHDQTLAAFQLFLRRRAGDVDLCQHVSIQKIAADVGHENMACGA